MPLTNLTPPTRCIRLQQRLIAGLRLGSKWHRAYPRVADRGQRVLLCEWRVYHLNHHRWYHAGLGDLKAFDVSHPRLELKPAHNLGFHATAEWTFVSSGYVAHVEHRGTEQPFDLGHISEWLQISRTGLTYLVVSRLPLQHHGMLCNEVIVSHLDCFWHTSCSAAEQSCSHRLFTSDFVVPSLPVVFALAHQMSPASASSPSFFSAKTFSPYLTSIPWYLDGCMVIKDEDVGARDSGLCCGFQSIWEQFGLYDQGFHLRCLECVCKFIWCMAWIDACKYSSEGKYAQESHRVVYLTLSV